MAVDYSWPLQSTTLFVVQAVRYTLPPSMGVTFISGQR